MAPNATPSFHVIGEIFDRVYKEAAVGSPPANYVQTTMVPAGGAAIVEFNLDVPGRCILVDHSLSRFERGLAGFLVAEGDANSGVRQRQARQHERPLIARRGHPEGPRAWSTPGARLASRAGHIRQAVRARRIRSNGADSRARRSPPGGALRELTRCLWKALPLAAYLIRAGRRPRVLEGGMTAWRRARSPCAGPQRLPVDRQVQLIAGVMVLTGVTLGTLVNPWFLAISAFFGAGLTFAGATGTCGLALLLLRMPWNRPRPAPRMGPAARAPRAAE